MFQLGSALLDACVLAVISKSDTYGYLLTQEIRTIIDVSESTLYPVLRRLQSDRMLVTYDSPYNGRNRRYYQITPHGHEHLSYLKNNWQHYKAAVDYLLFTTAPPPSNPPAPSDLSPSPDDPAMAAPSSAPLNPTTTASEVVPSTEGDES